jgi:hypothetical protein
MNERNGKGRIRLTNRASAAGARFAGALCARSFYGTGPAHKRNSSLLGRARQLQALVRQPLHYGGAIRGRSKGFRQPERTVGMATGLGGDTRNLGVVESVGGSPATGIGHRGRRAKRAITESRRAPAIAVSALRRESTIASTARARESSDLMLRRGSAIAWSRCLRAASRESWNMV